jgi:hypothetical protein
MAAVARTDITDKEQTDLENAEFENSVPVMMNGDTKVVIKGGVNGGAERVAAASGSLNSNAGVVMPAADKPGLFQENTIGKA